MTKTMIDVGHDGDVAVVTMTNGVTNPIGPEMVHRLSGALQGVADDEAVRGLVLTGNAKFFSIGLDIPRLFKMGREEFSDFYRGFNDFCLELLRFPKPTVAAIGGHAVAGGCVLALCCDYRFIAGGKKLMGLNEIKLGVPVPLPADYALQALVGFRGARDMIESGLFYNPEEGLEMGLVDRVLAADELLEQTVKETQCRAAMPPKALGVIKKNRTDRMVGDFLQRREADEKHFVDCWFSPQTRTLLEEALEKF